MNGLKESIENKLREFYRARINRDMVKVYHSTFRTLSLNLEK